MSLESRARHATSLITCTCNASRAPSDTGFKRRVSQSPGDFPFHLCPREPFALLTDSIRNSEIRNFAYSFHDPSSNKSPIYFACVKLGQDSARGGAFPKLCSAVFDICGGTELLLLWSWYLVFPQPKHFHTPEHEPILSSMSQLNDSGHKPAPTPIFLSLLRNSQKLSYQVSQISDQGRVVPLETRLGSRLGVLRSSRMMGMLLTMEELLPPSKPSSDSTPSPVQPLFQERRRIRRFATRKTDRNSTRDREMTWLRWPV